MRKSILAALAFGAATLSSGAALASDPGLPWCIVYTGDDVRLCDYPNYASCQATASGNVGYCTPNPAFFSSTAAGVQPGLQQPVRSAAASPAAAPAQVRSL